MGVQHPAPRLFPVVGDEAAGGGEPGWIRTGEPAVWAQGIVEAASRNANPAEVEVEMDGVRCRW